MNARECRCETPNPVYINAMIGSICGECQCDMPKSSTRISKAEISVDRAWEQNSERTFATIQVRVER